MRIIRSIFLTVFLLVFLSHNGFSQYTFFSPKEGFAIEVSLANTDLIRLPIYQNAITSLESVGDFIIGGTSAEKGLSPYIFLASLREKSMTSKMDLSQVVPNQQAIKSGFIKTPQKEIYAGTMPQDSDQEGGHLIKIMVDDGNIEVKDLGIPVRSEGVFALTSDKNVDRLYGITYPTGYFFEYDISSGVTKTYDEVIPANKKAHYLRSEFALTPEDYLSRALITDQKGIIYGSLPFGEIFTYDPQSQKFNRLRDSIPSVWGREAMAQVDSWCRTADGKLYGGNGADGQLFEVNTETGQIKNLGKPIMMGGLPGLVSGEDGTIYGLAGGAPGYSHLFNYHPSTGFKDLGNPQFKMVAPGIDQGIAWRGFQLSAITTSDDGKYIITGENEALSQLMVFPIK